MQKFDYKVMSDDKFTGVLAVARKTNGGKDVDLANNIKAFKKYKHSKVTKQAEAQESRMLHREGLVKKKKGKEDKVVGRKAPGRNAAVLGYSQVQGGEEDGEEGGEEDLAVFNEYVYNPEAPAGDGVPTVVEMSEFDTNDVDGMMPITGLVVETLDTDELSFDGDTMTVTMQAVPEAKIEEQAINELTRNEPLTRTLQDRTQPHTTHRRSPRPGACAQLPPLKRGTGGVPARGQRPPAWRGSP